MDARHAERTRTRLLLGGLICFVIWEVLRLTERAWGATLNRATRQALIIGSLIGWLGWSYYLIRTIRLGRIVRATPGLESMLNDEFVQLARLKAWRAGLFAVLVAQIGLMAFQVPGHIAPQLTMLVGVAASIGAFLIYERA